MRRWRSVIAIAALFALMLPLSTAAQPNPLPGATVRHQSKTDGIPISGPYEIVQFILDFAPGAQTPVHHHGGQLFVTVIEGAVSCSTGGVETTYQGGESFVEPAHALGQATNRTSGTTSVVITGILPMGAPLTTIDGSPGPNSPPGPTTRYLYRTPGMPLSGAFEIVHLVLDFVPGSQTPPHSHGGQGPVIILDGELTYATRHGQHVYKAGESFVEMPDHVGQASNTTDAMTSTFFSVINLKGNAVTSVVPSLDCIYSNATKQPLCFGFLRYWESFGGLAVYGYPLTGEMLQDGKTIQWFERARFEWSPGAWPERYDVLLGRIGAELAELTGVGLTP